jgi:hypothetical protein
MAMRRGRGPLTWGEDQGLRLVDSREKASHNATGHGDPAIASYRFRALKVPPGAPRDEPGTAARRGGGLADLGFEGKRASGKLLERCSADGEAAG